MPRPESRWGRRHTVEGLFQEEGLLLQVQLAEVAPGVALKTISRFFREKELDTHLLHLHGRARVQVLPLLRPQVVLESVLGGEHVRVLLSILRQL